MNDLYKKLKEINYPLYIETIEKSNNLIESIRKNIIDGKKFEDVSFKIEKFLIERTIQLKNY